MRRAPPVSPTGWRSVIETDRLRLVPLSSADADEMFGILADAELHELIGGAPLSRVGLRERYQRLEVGASADGSEVWANWIVRLRAEDIAIGAVQATIRASSAELAWVIGTAWQGHGYAGEAAQVLAAWLERAGVTRLTAHIHPQHTASQRTARRAGLRPTALLDSDGEMIWNNEADADRRR
ncbi:MAG: GNAT family N-acetyltransferase [Gaiellaceae bacterium]